MAKEKQALRYARRLVVIISVAVLMFVAVQVVLAFSPVDTVTVGPYKVDLVTYTLGTNESNWIYAITAVPGTYSDTSGLSHWILGFNLGCYTHVYPEQTITFETIDNIDQCNDGTYNCVDAGYYIEYGYDPTTGVDGLKWNFSSGEQLEPGGPDEDPFTHVFEMTLSGPDQYTGETVVGVKTGHSTLEGTILGPSCEPSAVRVASLSAKSGMATPVIVSLVVMAGLATTGIVVAQFRRKS
ncbi:MAG: hypothetical protein ACP5JG_09660 [Anaerolineae bacterium]